MRSRLFPILALAVLAALPAAAHTRTLSAPNGSPRTELSGDLDLESSIALPPIIADAPDTLPVFTRSRKLASGFFGWGAEPNIQRTLDLGQESRLGDDYMHARYYNPNLGRFLSVDPSSASSKPAAPQSWNRYGYSLNNPVRYTDPNGRCPQPPGAPPCSDMTITVNAVAPSESEMLSARLELGFEGMGLPWPDTPDADLRLTEMAEARRFQASIQIAIVPFGFPEFGATGLTPKAGSSGGPGAGKRFGQATKDAARAESGNRCVFCGTETTRQPGPSQSQIDHADPKSRGGNNTLDNAQNTCASCNQAKKARTTEEFLNWVKDLIR